MRWIGGGTGAGTNSLCDSRSRRQVRRSSRFRLGSRGHECDQDANRGAQGERAHGAADRFWPPGMSGLDADRRPAPPGAGDGGVDRALQPGPTTSKPGPQDADCQVRPGGRRSRSDSAEVVAPAGARAMTRAIAASDLRGVLPTIKVPVIPGGVTSAASRRRSASMPRSEEAGRRLGVKLSDPLRD